MDLTPYTCRGFHGEFDRLMRDVPVAGIDRQQTHSMIRLCDETEPILYGKSFSPRKIRYHTGARPKLETIAAQFRDNDGLVDFHAAMAWVRDHVRHPHFAGPVAPDRALCEEDLIASRVGWCNEQCRVFIALCEVLEVPARLCFLFHANGRTAHTACEAFEYERWQFFDVTYNYGFGHETRLIWSDEELCRVMDKIYAEPLAEYYRDCPAPIDITRGGDLFAGIGICNYLIEGVEAVS